MRRSYRVQISEEPSLLLASELESNVGPEAGPKPQKSGATVPALTDNRGFCLWFLNRELCKDLLVGRPSGLLGTSIVID